MILKVNGQTVQNYEELITVLHDSGIDTDTEITEWISGLDSDTLHSVGEMFMNFLAEALDFIGWFF